MKVLIFTFLVAFSSASPTFLREQNDIHDIKQTLEGMLKGIESELSLADIENCVENAVDIAKNLWKAVKDLKSGTTGGMISGLEEVASAISELPGAISACSSSARTVSKFELAIEAFINPWKFYFEVSRHLVINGIEIYDDIKISITEWDTGDYYNFGIYLGKAMAKMAFGEPRPIINN